MDDWADDRESLVSVSVTDEEKKMSPAGSGTSISTGEEKILGRNGEREKENGGNSAGTRIMDSIASKLGVPVSGHSSEQQDEGDGGGSARKEEDREDEVPAAEEASLLISIVED